MDSIVGRYPEKVAVVGSVVNLAEGEAIGDTRKSSHFMVSDDVSRVQQLEMPKRAYGARVLVGVHNFRSERGLVQACFDRALRVSPLVDRHVRRITEETERFFHRDGEDFGGRVVSHYVNRIMRRVYARPK